MKIRRYAYIKRSLISFLWLLVQLTAGLKIVINRLVESLF